MTTKKVYITNDITAHLYGDRVIFTDSANNECAHSTTSNEALKIAFEAIMDDFKEYVFNDAEDIDIGENDYGKPCIFVRYSLANNGFNDCHKALNLFEKYYAEEPNIDLGLSDNDTIYCEYYLNTELSNPDRGQYVYDLGIKFNTDFSDKYFEAGYGFSELTFELYIQ